METTMKTQYLVSDSNPDGLRLEDMLRAIRNDILARCSGTIANERTEAEHVMANNMQILPLLSDAIQLAEDSTEVLSRSFGEDHAAKGRTPT
ncbi:MAG: histidine kinase [Alphaproteobacteria bacterium]|nr:histidine kinase [Alphaproteobacteria bacterium]